jgi:hypothetical protein
MVLCPIISPTILFPFPPSRPSPTSSSNPSHMNLMTSAGTISVRDFHFALLRPPRRSDRSFRVSVPPHGLFCQAVNPDELLSGDFVVLFFAELQSLALTRPTPPCTFCQFHAEMTPRFVPGQSLQGSLICPRSASRAFPSASLSPPSHAPQTPTHFQPPNHDEVIQP